MKHTLTILIATLLVAIARPAAAQTRWLSYEPELMELDGRLVIESKYGPPNFGEQPKTDEKVRVPVLVLSDRANMLPDSGDDPNARSVYDVRQIQLAFPSSDTAHKALIGKQVVVTGTLFHGHTGHHYTDVVMNVQSIEGKPVGYDQRPFDVCRINMSEWYRSARYGSSNSMLAEFRAPIGEDEVLKSFKHRKSALIVNAGVQYLYDTVTPKSRPREIRIALSISKTEEDALDVLDNAVAGTEYRPTWGSLYVTKQVVVADVEHTLTLFCFDRRAKRNKY
jgi:hypothetical protein